MRSLSDLTHVIVPVPGSNAQIMVLDTGAAIPPEAQAMLAALHSRNPKGMEEHLKILERKGAAEFMETFYIGYGHQSIGDNGDATIAIEGVSMFVAKAIQEFPLYCGQEVSTRYVDFSKQPFLNPRGWPKLDEELGKLRAFYLEGLEAVIPHLKALFPIKPNNDPKVYEKAIKSRAFDIMRAFLPAGATTNLVWHGNLRQIGDRLTVLLSHPLFEVRNVAAAILEGVRKMFPSSFSKPIDEIPEENYAKESARRLAASQYYYAANKSHAYFETETYPVHVRCTKDTIHRGMLREFKNTMQSRPMKCELPYEIRECGQLEFTFMLDFASYRDLQRQRAVITRMPLLTTDHGFEDWYLENLAPLWRKKARQLLIEYQDMVQSVDDKYIRQYYIPMGYRCPIRTTGDLRAVTYLVELRTGKTVHPTLRIRSIEMGKILGSRFDEYGLKLYLDTSPDDFDIRRGLNDIVEKE